jgi:CMP-2-keto-3-deoxyoctulosonic acid synthetase
MKVVGSVIARAGSKRLPYKNLLPYKGVPLVRHALIQLTESQLFSEVILSTDCELIARTCMDLDGVKLLKRPEDLAKDTTASIPVFQHIIENFPCDIHLNYNCNFPECPKDVFREAISNANTSGESLSLPYAVWAQTSACLNNYGDPFQITAQTFDAPSIHSVDIHTHEDLILVHQETQKSLLW